VEFGDSLSLPGLLVTGHLVIPLENEFYDKGDDNRRK
jgi:hypothetical protein